MVQVSFGGNPIRVQVGENTQFAANRAAAAEASADEAVAAAAYAEGFSGTVYADVSAGEAGTTAGTVFRVSNGDGTLTPYLRTSGGSEELDPLATSAALLSPDPDKGAELVGFKRGEAGAIVRTLRGKAMETRSVLDFGADPTGAVDSTAAFNAATQADAVWSTALEYHVYVPPGRYKLDGTIHVRNGQTLYSDGAILDASLNNDVPRIVMGKRRVSGGMEHDPHGPPPMVVGFRTIGGSGLHGFIQCFSPGWTIAHMFMTACGVGIELIGEHAGPDYVDQFGDPMPNAGVACADGELSNIQIDMALIGLLMHGETADAPVQNITLSGVRLYSANYGIEARGNVNDVQIGVGVVSYCNLAAVVASGDNNGIAIADTTFNWNAQPVSSGFVPIQIDAGYSRFTFKDCQFSNWKGHVANIGGDSATSIFVFTGCDFDGTPVNGGYDASTTAKGPSIGPGSYVFEDCTWRNLSGAILTIGNGLGSLALTGGAIQGCPPERFAFTTTGSTGNITVRNVAGFAPVLSSGATRYTILPWWNGSCPWRVTVRGNPNNAGDALYGRFAECIADAPWAYDSTQKRFAELQVVNKSTTRAQPPDLAPAVCLGTTPGGATESTSRTYSGTITVAVTTSAPADFAFSASTLL